MRYAEPVRDTGAANVRDNSRRLPDTKISDSIMSETEEIRCSVPDDHSPDSPDIRSHQRRLWSTTCGLPNLPCFRDDVSDAGEGVLHLKEGDPEVESGGAHIGASTHSAHEHGVDVVEKSGNCEAGSANVDAEIRVIIRRKRSRLPARKGTGKRILSRASAFLAEERACESTVSVQGSGSPDHILMSMVTSNGSIQAAVTSPTESLGDGVSNEQSYRSSLRAEPDVEVGCNPAEVVAQSFGTPVEKHEKEAMQVVSNQRKGGDGFNGLLPRTGPGRRARGVILSEVAEEAGVRISDATDDRSSQGTQILHSGATTLASLESESVIKEDLAASSSRTGHNRVVGIMCAAESGRAVSSKSDDAKELSPSSLQVERPKCLRTGMEELAEDGEGASLLATKKQPSLVLSALQTYAGKVTRLSHPSAGKAEKSVQPALCTRNAGSFSDPKVALSETEGTLIVEGLSPTSPFLPPGFEGKFACMVSEQDSTPCKNVVRVCSEKDDGHVLLQSLKGKSFPADPGLQTTACSSNGKEHLGGNGSQTDSDDVPLSGKAESSPLYRLAQVTGSCDAPRLHGALPRTPHPVPPWPTTCLPLNSSGPTWENGAGQPPVCLPPHVSGALSLPGREMVQMKVPRPAVQPALSERLKGISPSPAIPPIPGTPDPMEDCQYLNLPCSTVPYAGLSATPGASGIAILSHVTSSPRQQSPAAHRPLMDAYKQKVADCSSGSTPVIQETQVKMVGQAVFVDTKGAGSFGDNVAFGGGTSHLADPMRSFYIGNIPKGLDDTQGLVEELLKRYLSTFEFVPQSIVHLEQLYMRERCHSHFAFAEFSVSKVAMIVRDACKFDPTALVLKGTPLKVGRNNQDTTNEISFRESLVFQSRTRTLDPAKVIYIGNVPLSWQDDGKLKSYFSKILKGSDAHLSGDLVYAVYIYPAECDAYLELISEALADALIYKCTKDPKLLDALDSRTFFCRHSKFVPLCAALSLRRPRATVSSVDAAPVTDSFQSTLYIAKLPVVSDGYLTRRLRDLFEVVLGTLKIEKRIFGNIRSYSWPPGRNFAYVIFDSEAVADAVMDQYIDKLQTFCIKDMPFCIFRHQKYIRPGAIYRSAENTSRSCRPTGLDREIVGSERRGQNRKMYSSAFGQDDLEEEEVEEGEHRPEMRRRSRIESVPVEDDAASRKVTKLEKGNFASTAYPVTNGCRSTSIHSEDTGVLKPKSKSASLESSRVICVRGLARGLFEPAIKGALNELFERALCSSGLLDHQVHVVRSLDFMPGSSEASVNVQSCELADFLLAYSAPLKLAGEVLLLRPGKRHQGGDAKKNVPFCKDGKAMGHSPLNHSCSRNQRDGARGSRDVAQPSSWGIDSWRRSSPKFGGPSPDSHVQRGMGPPLPPYPVLQSHDHDRPPMTKVSLSAPPGYAEPPTRASPCLSPPPGYAEPAARAPSILSPPPGYAKTASAGGYNRLHIVADSHLSKHDDGSEVPSQCKESGHVAGKLVPEPMSIPTSPGRPTVLTSGKRLALNGVTGPDEYRNKKPKIVGAMEAPSKKNTGGWLEEEDEDDEDGDDRNNNQVVGSPTLAFLQETNQPANNDGVQSDPDVNTMSIADGRIRSCGHVKRSHDDIMQAGLDWKHKQGPGSQALNDRVKPKDPWPIRGVRRTHITTDNGDKDSTGIRFLGKSSWLGSMDLRSSLGGPAGDTEPSIGVHCRSAVETGRCLKEEAKSQTRSENSDVKLRGSSSQVEKVEQNLCIPELKQLAVKSKGAGGLHELPEANSMDTKVDLERSAQLDDVAATKSPAIQRTVLKFDLNEVMVESPSNTDGFEALPVPDDALAASCNLPSQEPEDQHSIRVLEEDGSKLASDGTLQKRGEDPKSPSKETRRCSQDRRDERGDERREGKRDDRKEERRDGRREDRRDDRRDDRKDDRREDRREDRGEDRGEDRKEDRRGDRRNDRRDDRRDSKLDANSRSGDGRSHRTSDDRRSKYSSLRRSHTLSRPGATRSGGGRNFDEDRQLYKRYRSFDEDRDYRHYRPER